MIDIIEFPRDQAAASDGHNSCTPSLERALVAFGAAAAALYRETETGEFIAIAWAGGGEAPPSVRAATELAQRLRSTDHGVLMIDADRYGDLLVSRGVALWNLKRLIGGHVPVESDARFALSLGFAEKFSPDEAWLARYRGLLNEIGGVLSNAIKTEEIVRLRAETVSLSNIQTEISQLHDLDAALSIVVRKTCELMNADTSYIALADNDHRKLKIVHLYGCFTRRMQGLELDYGDGVPGVVAATRRPIYVADFALDPDQHNPPHIAEALAAENIACGMSVPMTANGRLVGVLSALSRRVSAFTEDQVAVLQRLGADAAVAIENARNYDAQRETINELDRRATANKMFMELSVQNAGMQAIAEAISMLSQASVLIEDTSGRLVASASRSGAREETRSDTTHLLLNRPEAYPYLARLHSTRSSVLVPCLDGVRHGGLLRLVAPVIVGNTLLGTVSILDVESEEDVSKAVVDQACMVVALEFKKKEAARSTLLQRSLAAQENERLRIARELHDGTSQDIVALSVGLSTTLLALESRPDQVEGHIEECKRIADKLLDSIKQATSDLRPADLDQLGLDAALRNYANQRLEAAGIRASFDGNALGISLDSFQELMLYRTVQEALSNVARHSEAREVRVSMNENQGYLEVRIADDGVGFGPLSINLEDPTCTCFGLKGMRERVETMAGDMNVSSLPGEGCTIEIHLPLQIGEEKVYASYGG